MEVFALVIDLNCKPLYKPNTDNMDSDGYVRLYKELIDSLERCTTFKSKDLFKDPRTKVQVKCVQHTDIF